MATAPQPSVLDRASRLTSLLTELDQMLNQKYAFDVYAKDSINFGIMVTYRQTWKPEKYQVGELVSTLPLAPKEVRRYTTRRVTKKTRAVKEVEDAMQTRRSESADTSRVDAEIVEKAQNKSNFNLTAKESLGGEGYNIEATQQAGGEQAKQSEKVKKDFRESVLKSAEEYKQQHRTEIDTTASEETEETTFHEIQNPNDELAVTYLFYELQRTYRISEKIHKLTPVILVAQAVPAPHEIDDAWLTAHDWILRRVLLDDSFKSPIEYLTQSFVGAEVNIRILESNAQAQKALVDSIRQQLQVQVSVLDSNQRDVADAVQNLAQGQQTEGILNTVKRIFDPIGITGEADTGQVSAAQTMVDYARETVDRAERERQRLMAQLGVATTALQIAIDKLSAAVKEHYDRVAEIDRLRVHVKENILYYMQAIWSHEPPDQRFFRLYDLDVPIVQPVVNGVTVNLADNDEVLDWLRDRQAGGATLPVPDVTVTTRKLVEVANLDKVLGYKGNYAIFELTANNYITLHMMQDYLEVSDDVRLRDPDDVANYSVDDLQALARCLYEKNPEEFRKNSNRFKQLIYARLISGQAEDDRVIVPTSSLYIEALVSTHPLLEDFKLIHRALDVKKVQAEVRHAELENIRLAARALRGKDEDPDIEKKIVIEGGPPPAVIPDE
jgi:hypothetical protein